NADSEDEGWVLSLVCDKQSFESQCWIFDAREIARGPVARLRLPARVPAGFHAQWVAGEAIWPSA
ncbi:MAG: carotenoid oxygenase family protein, partial [Myxococcota bacterium]